MWRACNRSRAAAAPYLRHGGRIGGAAVAHRRAFACRRAAQRTVACVQAIHFSSPPGLLRRPKPRPAPVAHVTRALQRAAAHGGRAFREGRGGCGAAAVVACAAPQRSAAPLLSRSVHLMAAPIAAALPFKQKHKSAEVGAPHASKAKRPKTAAALPAPAASGAAAEPLLDLGELVPATMLARPRCECTRCALCANAVSRFPCAA